MANEAKVPKFTRPRGGCFLYQAAFACGRYISKPVYKLANLLLNSLTYLQHSLFINRHWWDMHAEHEYLQQDTLDLTERNLQFSSQRQLFAGVFKGKQSDALQTSLWGPTVA